MDFLFDNPLASMYGPYFLVLYLFFNIITLITFSILKKNLDKSSRLPMPPIPSNPDPYEIAYLRGGENELARSVVFSLQQKGFLKINNDGKTASFHKTDAQNDSRKLKSIEKDALLWFGSSREAKEIFQSSGLSSTLRSHYEMYQARLEQQHLVPNEDLRQKRSRLQLIAILAVGGLGLYKLAAAIINGYTNVWGLIILGAIGLIIIAFAGKLARQTALGKAYLERLQIAFDRLKNTNQLINSNPTPTPQPVFGAVDPLLLSVGVFGGAVLAGTMYDDYNQAFQKANTSVGSSRSCGSSCGSSSCSSGGGSCGRGGCGGCGGGCS